MKDNIRKTDFYFSSIIENLYGLKDYKRVKSFTSTTSIRKYYLKIIKSIKYAIEETITITDTTHRNEMHFIIENSEKTITDSKTFHEMDQRMIAFQSEIIFSLIGFSPKRLGVEKTINNRNLWKLDLYRQIEYTQTAEQKKNLIFKAVQGKYHERFGSWQKFTYDIYSKECNDNPALLVNWIKVNHPDIYLDLF